MQFEKKNTTATIKAENFPSEIRSISLLPAGVSTISLQSNTSEGILSGGGYASNGMKVTVEAAPESMFKGWYKSNLLLTNNPSYTFQVQEDSILEGKFYEETELNNWLLTPDFNSIGNSFYWSSTNNLWIARTGSTTKDIKCLYSLDGFSWTSSNLSGLYLTAITKWTNDRSFGFIGKSASSVITGAYYYTINGKTWISAGTNSAFANLSNIIGSCYGNGLYVLTFGWYNSTSRSFTYCTSTDGIKWTKYTWSSGVPTSLIYGKDKFIVLTTASTYYISENAKAPWTAHQSPITPVSLIYGKDIYLLTGIDTNNSGKVYYSYDCINWNLVNGEFPAYVKSLFNQYSGRYLLYSSNNLGCWYSYDCINWTKGPDLPEKVNALKSSNTKIMGRSNQSKNFIYTLDS